MASFEKINNLDNSSLKGTTLQFDDSKFKLRSRAVLGEPQIPGMIRFLVGKNLVKTEAQAIIILLVIAALIIGTSVFIFKKQGVPQTTLDPKLFEYR